LDHRFAFLDPNLDTYAKTASFDNLLAVLDENIMVAWVQDELPSAISIFMDVNRFCPVLSVHYVPSWCGFRPGEHRQL
jgi:hypothetical protein